MFQFSYLILIILHFPRLETHITYIYIQVMFLVTVMGIMHKIHLTSEDMFYLRWYGRYLYNVHDIKDGKGNRLSADSVMKTVIFNFVSETIVPLHRTGRTSCNVVNGNKELRSNIKNINKPKNVKQ